MTTTLTKIPTTDEMLKVTVEDGKQKALEKKDKEQVQFLAMTKQ